MAKKTANLIHGLDDKPPLTVAALLGLQHVFVLTSGWVLVVVIVTTVGGTQEEVANVLRMSMIASGVATILQSLPNSPVGSGYFCPIGSGPAYVSASILAGRIGGLSAVFTMTTLAGVFEGLLARIVPRLRPLFPPEVTGLVVTMVGVELVAVACPRFLGFQDGGTGPQGIVTAVATATLAAMIGPTVWSKGKLRLYPVLVGLLVGYLLAYIGGVLQTARLREILDAPMFSLPRKAHSGWSLDVALLPAFLIAGLASTLKSVGDLSLCQKVNDPDWKRTDMQSVRGGIYAGAIGTGLSGLLGGVGQSTFSSNVGLSLATGATSRSIAVPCGILMILLAFLPKPAAFFAAMPDPVMGAILVYVACYMILAGIQIITSRMLDARRTFVVGIALIFGLSVDMVPGMYRDVPGIIQPLFSSSLAISTVLVVLLNLLFRIGITKRQVLELTPGVDGSEKIFEFMENQGSVWGARREVIMRAMAAINEFVESAVRLGLVKGKAQADVSFDEFNLDVDIRYSGRLMELPSKRPTEDALLADDNGVASLSGFLIRQYADRVEAASTNGQCRIHLHFDHYPRTRLRLERVRETFSVNHGEERMERSVEVLAIILFGVLGLSHILQPKAWAEFFILLRSKGEPGAFVDGFLNLPLGGIIVGFHNTWSGIPVVLTLVGWCLLIKGVIRFCAPKLALRMMARVSVERSWEFQVAGAGLVVLAGLVGYGVYAV